MLSGLAAKSEIPKLVGWGMNVKWNESTPNCLSHADKDPYVPTDLSADPQRSRSMMEPANY